MKLRFIDELNVNNVQGHTNQFPNDNFIGLLLRVRLDNTAGDDKDETNVGRVRLNFRGDDIINASWHNLRIFTDLEFGRPENPAAGATWDGGIFIPFYHPDLPNAIQKRRGDNMDFYMAAASTCTVSAIVQIYGVIDDISELYVPKLIDYTDTAAPGQHKVTIDQDNIAQILVYEPATTVQTLLQILVDSELIYSADWANLTNLSNIIARIEAAALGVIVFDMVIKGQISEALSDVSVLLSTGGVGAYDYMVQSLTFNANQTIKTAKEVLAITNFKLRRKINKGAISGAVVSQIHDATADSVTAKQLINRPEFAAIQPQLSQSINEPPVD